MQHLICGQNKRKFVTDVSWCLLLTQWAGVLPMPPSTLSCWPCKDICFASISTKCIHWTKYSKCVMNRCNKLVLHRLCQNTLYFCTLYCVSCANEPESSSWLDGWQGAGSFIARTVQSRNMCGWIFGNRGLILPYLYF